MLYSAVRAQAWHDLCETPSAGFVLQVVHKRGVIFVSSAGNAGPALSTVGAPGGTSSAILSIGAYVSPSMAAMAHSVRQEIAQVPLHNAVSHRPCCYCALSHNSATDWCSQPLTSLLLATQTWSWMVH